MKFFFYTLFIIVLNHPNFSRAAAGGPDVPSESVPPSSSAEGAEVLEILDSAENYYENWNAVNAEIRDSRTYNIIFQELFGESVSIPKARLPIFKEAIEALLLDNIFHIRKAKSLVSIESVASKDKEDADITALVSSYIMIIDAAHVNYDDAKKAGLTDLFKKLNKVLIEAIERAYKYVYDKSSSEEIQNYYREFQYDINQVELSSLRKDPKKNPVTSISEEGGLYKIKMGPAVLTLKEVKLIEIIEESGSKILTIDYKIMIPFLNIKLSPRQIEIIQSEIVRKFEEHQKNKGSEEKDEEKIRSDLRDLGLSDADIEEYIKGMSKKSDKPKKPKKHKGGRAAKSSSSGKDKEESGAAASGGGASEGAAGEGPLSSKEGVSEREADKRITLLLAARQLELEESRYREKEQRIQKPSDPASVGKAKEFFAGLNVFDEARKYSWADLVKNMKAIGVNEANGRGTFRLPFDSNKNYTANPARQKRMQLHKPHPPKLYPILVKYFLLPRMHDLGALTRDDEGNYAVSEDYLKRYVYKS